MRAYFHFKPSSQMLISILMIFAILIIQLLVWIQPVHAEESPSLWVWLGDGIHISDTHGYNWAIDANITMTFDDADTTLSPDHTAVAVNHDPPVIFDIWQYDPAPGDTVTMSDGFITISHVITALKVMEVSSLEDRISGTAEPGAVVNVGADAYGRDLIVPESGNWTADLTVMGDDPEEDPFDLESGMHLFVSQNQGDGTTGYSYMIPDPWFYVWIRNSDGLLWDIHGYDWPENVPVTMTLDNVSTPASPDFTRIAYMEDPPWGGDKQLVFDITGITAAPGDIVTMTDGLTANLSHTITSVRITTVNALNESVTGVAEPGSLVNVSIDSTWRWETTGPDGTWSADFSVEGDEEGETIGNITPGMVVHANQSNGGGTTDVNWTVNNPFFDVWMTNSGTAQQISAYDWPEGVPVTMTFDDSDTPASPDFSQIAYMEEPEGGGEKEIGYDISSYDGTSGDVVTMTDGMTALLSHTITSLHINEVNHTTDVVSGTADPDSLVAIKLYISEEPGYLFRFEIAGSDGSWSADFSQPGDEEGEDTADIQLGMKLQVENQNGDGWTIIPWEIPNVDGVISGTVYDLSSNPITGTSLDVSAETGSGTISTCTDPSTGSYRLDGLPLYTTLTIVANQYMGTCEMNNYGWEYWERKTSLDPTPITLTESDLEEEMINFQLGTVYPGVETFFFNQNLPIISELAARQAIAYGTDRQRMQEEVWAEMGYIGSVQNSYVTSLHWTHANDSEVTVYSYNPSLARGILNAAGWTDTNADGIRDKGGQELVLNFVTSPHPARQAATAIFVQNMLDIGIQINAAFLFYWQIGDDVHITEFVRGGSGTCGSLEDTTCVPGRQFVTGEDSFLGYSSPISDSLYADAQATEDLDEIRALAIQHQSLISHDLPVLPLFTRISGYWISGNVGLEGVTVTYDNGTALTTTSDEIGNYQFSVPGGWTGVVTPTLAGYSFSPESQEYTSVWSEQSNQDYAFTNCYAFTTHVNPVGSGNVTFDPPPDCSGGLFRSGTTVKLIAEPAAGYGFINWSWFESTTNPISFKMTTDREITANFGALPNSFGKSSPVDAATNRPASLSLTWNESANFERYEYCLDTTNDDVCDADNWINVGTSTQVSLTSLGPATYRWQVRAKNVYGYTYANAGDWWAFTVLPIPGAFYKLSPSNGNLNQPTNPTLKWGASSNAVKYEYCFDTSNNNACNTGWKSAGTSRIVTLSNLAAGKYFWQVRAKNATGITLANNKVWWSFTVPPKPGAFTKTSPANNTAGLATNLTLKWALSSNAFKYEYCIDTTNNNTCNATWKSVGTKTSVYLTGLLKEKKYYWMVRAVNAVGTTYSNNNVWWNFTTKP